MRQRAGAVPALASAVPGVREHDHLAARRRTVAADLRLRPADPRHGADVLRACVREALAPSANALEVAEDGAPPAHLRGVRAQMREELGREPLEAEVSLARASAARAGRDGVAVDGI